MADLNKMAKEIAARLQKGKPTCKQVQKDHAALDQAIKSAPRTAKGREEAATVRRQLFSAGRRLACAAMEIKSKENYRQVKYGNHHVRSQRSVVKLSGLAAGQKQSAHKHLKATTADARDALRSAYTNCADLNEIGADLRRAIGIATTLKVPSKALTTAKMYAQQVTQEKARIGCSTQRRRKSGR